MATFTEQKKRTDLSDAEKKQIQLIKELLRVMGKERGKMPPCDEYNPKCPACVHYCFIGHLETYLNDLEY